jgi:superfamily II DNA or RNA helicase
MAATPKCEALPLFDHLLRPYQKQAIEALRTDWRSGLKKLLLELPTGTGKTRTFVLLPREGARTLVIVPLISLIGQTVDTIRALRKCDPDIEQADLSAIPETEFIVASWQTLLRNDRWRKFVGKVDLVVVDEAHWGFTQQSKAILDELVEGGARVLGCTATAYRADRVALLGFYEKISYCYSLRQAIDDGYLCPPKVQVHYVKSINLSKAAKKAAADFNAEELDRILRSEEALHDIAGLIQRNHVPGRQGIVFAHSVKQACLLRDLLLDRHGMPCSVVHSYQSNEEYAGEIKAFMSGDREIVINVGILTTGWDHPPVSEIFIAKPTKALNKYTQMVGRGTRVLPGVIDGLETAEERKAAIAASQKPSFFIHDLTDSSRCHQLCSAIDVLSGQTKAIKVKVRDQATEEEMGLEEIDAAVAAEMAAEAEIARLEREAERRRRAALVVGVEFGSEGRDPFAQPDRKYAKRQVWRMPFGKFKGQPLDSNVIPTSYLEWVLREAKLSPMWRQAVESAVGRRNNEKRFA